MKILLVNDDFPPQSNGGAAVIVQRLAEVLGSKHEVSVLTVDQAKSDTSTQDGYQLVKIESDYNLRWRAYVSLYNTKALQQIANVTDQQKPDVVNFHNIHTHVSYAAMRLAQDKGCRVVFTGHDVMPFYYGRLNSFLDVDGDGFLDSLDYTFPFQETMWRKKLEFNPFRNKLTKYFLTNFTNKLVVVSDALKEVYLQNGVHNTQVIYNGIDVPQWQVTPKELAKFKQGYQIPKGRTIFFGGRLRVDKGSRLVLKALTYDPQLHLVVAGDDRGVADMKTQARKLKVLSRITFVGKIPIDQMKYLYHSTTATIVPSICFDSFPNNAVEAMACGKPVLLSKFAGRLPQIRHNQTALLFNPFSEKEYRYVVGEISNKKRMTQIGADSKVLVAKELSIKAWLSAYESVFASN
jgi:glycosyltransferase involved in cell wall biosynthesis